MKAIQKTSLSCGLLNAPVKIFAASSKDPELSFTNCGPQGETLERLDVIAEDPDDRIYTDDKERRMVTVVDNDEIEKSYNGRLISKIDLEAVKEESLTDEDGNDLKLINIDTFVSLKEVPFERTTKLYYLGPDPQFSTKSFKTFMEALKKKKAAAIAKVVIRSRQTILAIYVKDDILYASSLSFAASLNNREDAELTTDAKTVKKEVEVMGGLIDALMGTASEIDAIEDTYVSAKREMVEKVIEGEPLSKDAKPKKKAPVNDGLMEALEESIKAAKKKRVKA